MPVILEICVDDAAGLDAALMGGADRIELCAALGTGGVTPSAGFMRLAAARRVPVSAMIRPRPGDFVFSAGEADLMMGDIDAVRQAGLSGVVLGASLAGGGLDTALLARLCDHAEGLDLTLHRAFDLVADFDEALEAAVGLGFSRILTSGGATTALAGIDRLRALAARAAGRISIMPGAGVRPGSIAALRAIAGVTEFHASCSVDLPFEAASAAAKFGFAGPGLKATDAAMVRALKEILLARP